MKISFDKQTNKINITFAYKDIFKSNIIFTKIVKTEFYI